MTFKDHFSSHADVYAAHRPIYPRALVDWLASIAPAQERALDVGCGTGQLSVPLADAFDAVVATDASASQIAQAAAHPKVTYRTAPCEASGVPDASVDLVTVAQAAHWFNLPAFYGEARRVARPGAVLALISYGVIHGTGTVEPVLQRFYWHDIADHWPPERRHVEASYATLPFPFAEMTPPTLSIEVEWTLADLLGYVDTWSAVRVMERTIGRAPLAAFASAMTGAWGAPQMRRPFRFPLTVRAGRIAR